MSLVTETDVIRVLNGEALCKAEYYSALKRQNEGHQTTIGRLVSGGLQEITEEWFKYPVSLVRGARLRQLVDEWIATGVGSDGSVGARRSLTRTSEATEAVKRCAATNPCSLFFREKTGELFACVGGAPASTVFPPLPFHVAVSEAERMFTSMMMSEWKIRLYRCDYSRCGLYFVHPKPRRVYPHGTFCSAAHQRHASAAARTQKRREGATLWLLAHAAQWLSNQRDSGRGWQRDGGLKKGLAAALSGQIARNPNLRAGRESVKTNWVTWHMQEIEKRRRRLVTLR